MATHRLPPTQPLHFKDGKDLPLRSEGKMATAGAGTLSELAHKLVRRNRSDTELCGQLRGLLPPTAHPCLWPRSWRGLDVAA